MVEDDRKVSRLARFLAMVLRPFNVMVKWCSWCNSLKGFKRGGTGITHIMCKRCYDKERS